MDAAKRVQLRVKRSQVLLERMVRERERVLKALRPAEREEVMEELHMLVARAATVRRGSELLGLTNSVFQLVNKRPALEKEFRVVLWRGGDWSDINNILSGFQAVEYADQIANSVERLGQAIGQELQKLPEQGSEDVHR